jgi:hypothetical protein
MGVVIKYLLDFVDTGLKVSNDLFLATVLTDAEVKVDMRRGSAGTQFELKLIDLPHPNITAIEERLRTRQPFHVKVKLGYMDTFSSSDFQEVVDGFFTKIERKIESNKEVTIIKGRERVTHLLTEARVDFSVDESTSPQTAAQRVLERASVGTDAVTVRIEGERVVDRRLVGTAIEVLDEIAYAADAEMLVVDGKVNIGMPITNDSYVRPPFSIETNLAEFRPFTQSLPADNATTLPQPTPATEATGFRFVITGDPKLRPAHRMGVDVDAPGYTTTQFRVHTLVHSLSLEGGYVCEGVALKPCETAACRRQQDAIGQPTAQVVADSISRRIRTEAQARPPIEVTSVKEHQAGSSSQTPHRSTLYFGQQFLRTETQPSINVAVEEDEEKLLRTKPVVSPFAWYKCGLVVPVYKGMKAVVGHNLNLRDDALVTGFIWSQTPSFPPPAANAGDWWLCLPIDFAADSTPTDSTKAANDLTANNGHRTIEIKGLRIRVGASKVSNVGVRPEEAADNELLIEHESAQIKVGSDGTIEMKASSGGPTLKITSSGVEIV